MRFIKGKFGKNKPNNLMITYINNLPENMVGFRSQGEVTSKDFELVKKHVKELVERTGELNYLLLLENSPKDFSVGAWLQDLLLGIENITKWNRVAIVSDVGWGICIVARF